MTLLETTIRMMRFKSWANGITFGTVMGLPAGEALRPRTTRFGNMVHTLNHVFVVDDIFRAHLEGREHGYAARNTPRRLCWMRCGSNSSKWMIGGLILQRACQRLRSTKLLSLILSVPGQLINAAR